MGRRKHGFTRAVSGLVYPGAECRPFAETVEDMRLESSRPEREVKPNTCDTHDPKGAARTPTKLPRRHASPPSIPAFGGRPVRPPDDAHIRHDGDARSMASRLRGFVPQRPARGRPAAHAAP